MLGDPNGENGLHYTSSGARNTAELIENAANQLKNGTPYSRYLLKKSSAQLDKAASAVNNLRAKTRKGAVSAGGFSASYVFER